MGYDTQKPEGLLERVIKVSSKDGALVADFFCGSGTTLAVAEKLGCRWIGCDVSRFAVHVTRKRLLGIDDCKPFEVLNLGKYERQYWQGVTFGESRNRSLTERALYEYLAFILKLYGAEPVPGLMHLHGKKGRALVHIGAVDAPVTIAEIDARENVAEKYGYWLRAAVQRWAVSLLFKQEISAAPHRCQSLDDINSGVVAALKQQEEGMSTEDVTFSKFIIDIIVTDMTTEQHHVIEDQYVDTTLNESQVTYRF